MRKILLALLLWPLLAAAQPGTFPPLIGARGTANPTNCAVGQLFFRSDVTAGQNIYGCTSANTWTAQGASSIAIGGAVSGGAAYAVLREDGSQNLTASSALLFGSAAAGHGLQIAAGTAITDVAALSVTRTNNNAAVVTGVKFAFTDTTSATGFLPFQVTGGASATTNLFSVDKNGGTLVNDSYYVPVSGTYSLQTVGSARGVRLTSGGGGQVVVFSETSVGIGSGDTAWSRVAAGVMGAGTGAAAAVDGTIAATNYRVAAKPVILGTAPTIASGGCTSPSITNTNGTAYITIGVGTSCSGSQPVVFTLPAATTGWNCYARNASNAATSSPRQSSAVSTTSVTITNYSATLGTAAAWTDADVVVVSCLGG